MLHEVWVVVHKMNNNNQTIVRRVISSYSNRPPITGQCGRFQAMQRPRRIRKSSSGLYKRYIQLLFNINLIMLKCSATVYFIIDNKNKNIRFGNMLEVI